MLQAMVLQSRTQRGIFCGPPPGRVKWSGINFFLFSVLEALTRPIRTRTAAQDSARLSLPHPLQHGENYSCLGVSWRGDEITWAQVPAGQRWVLVMNEHSQCYRAARSWVGLFMSLGFSEHVSLGE